MSAAAVDVPDARRFDFWLGDWVVTAADADARLLGHNRIERVAGGCALAEHWRGASGLHGRSLSAWDAAAACWRQFWVGGDGLVLQLAGGWRGDRMLLEGSLPGPGGAPQAQRIAWIPHPDGRLSQCWDTSDDGGAHWQPAFVGLYQRVAAG